jgi:hypothetical protein
MTDELDQTDKKPIKKTTISDLEKTVGRIVDLLDSTIPAIWKRLDALEESIKHHETRKS